MQLLSLSIPSYGLCKGPFHFDHVLSLFSLLASLPLRQQTPAAWSSCLINIRASPHPATLPLSFLEFEMICLCRSPFEMGAVSSKGLHAICTLEV